MEKRPKGVTVMSLLVFIIAAIALIVGISVLVVGTPLDILWTIKPSFSPSIRGTMIGIIFGVFVMIIGFILLASSYGLLKGNKIAWWAVAILFGVNALGDLISLIMGNIQSISGVIIVGILLVYMTRPHVRNYFKING